MKLPIGQIFDRRKVNRREKNEANIKQLAEDFRLNGQITPISVRKADDGTWDLVAGATRIEAAKLNGWTEIEAYDTGIRGATEAAALAENVKRYNLSPVEEADQLIYMHDELGIGINQIAEKTGHSNSWVQDRLMIANFPENFKSALHRRKLSIGAAGQLMLITDEPLRDWYLHLAEVNGATVNQCKAWYDIWKGTQALTTADGEPQPISQAMPLPPLQRINCFTCGEPVENVDALVIRICIPCHGEITRVKLHEPEPPNGASPPERS